MEGSYFLILISEKQLFFLAWEASRVFFSTHTRTRIRISLSTCCKGKLKIAHGGTSLMVQWLGPCTSTAGGMGSIPGWGTKILHVVWHGRKKIACSISKRGRRGKGFPEIQPRSPLLHLLIMWTLGVHILGIQSVFLGWT